MLTRYFLESLQTGCDVLLCFVLIRSRFWLYVENDGEYEPHLIQVMAGAMHFQRWNVLEHYIGAA